MERACDAGSDVAGGSSDNERRRNTGSARRYQVLSIDVEREMTLVKLKLQVPPRQFTDMLSCLKANGTWKLFRR